MQTEITLIFTFRDRDILRIKKCFDSLDKQENLKFKVVFVDYGSSLELAKEVKILVNGYSFASYIYTYSIGQPWNKSRAINIALNNIKTPYTFIGDIDMIFDGQFISKLYVLKQKKVVTYFKVGYLSEKETKNNVAFNDYEISHYSNSEATGLTLFPTELLFKCNGFDEFYHFWGSEDTDMHCRAINANCTVNFYTEKTLMLHQYHKPSRTKHDDILTINYVPNNIFRINMFHQLFNKKNNYIANIDEKIGGLISTTDYNCLENDWSKEYFSDNKQESVEFYVKELLGVEKGEILKINFKESYYYKSFKYRIKMLLNKQTIPHFSLKEINDILVKELIFKHRYKQYIYKVSNNLDQITLTIKL